MATLPPLSVLDLFPVAAGASARDVIHSGVALAQAAEALGYQRYWIAEHHNMPSIATAAPEVLIAAIAAVTTTIRVGAGGIMVPNHAPLHVVEIFRTLEPLSPGRAPRSRRHARRAPRVRERRLPGEPSVSRDRRDAAGRGPAADLDARLDDGRRADRRLAAPMRVSFAQAARGGPRPAMPSIEDALEYVFSSFEIALLEQFLGGAIVGGPETVRAGIDAVVARLQPEELMIATMVADPVARLRSYERVAQLA